MTKNRLDEEHQHLLVALIKAGDRVIADRSEENLGEFHKIVAAIEAYEQELGSAGLLKQITSFLAFIPILIAFVLEDKRALTFASALAGLVIVIGVFAVLQRPRETGLQIALVVDSPEPVAYVLAVQEGASYSQVASTQDLPLTPATQLTSTDVILGDNVQLEVLCPDGSIQMASITNASLNCFNVHSDETSVTRIKMDSSRVLKGGNADNPTIQYVISPRFTAIRSSQTAIIFNPVLSDIKNYTITIREAGEVVWESPRLDPDVIVSGDVAKVDLPIILTPRTPYTVEVCVLLNNFERRCTTDPGLASPYNLAFYYVPIEVLNNRFPLSSQPQTPQELLAQAIILAQPLYETSTGEAIGFYDESINLLNRLVAEFGDSEQVSAATHNLRGEIYRRMRLPRAAAAAFEHALALSQPGTEEAAHAATGLAMTTPNHTLALNLYDLSLDHYAAYLSPVAFEDRLRNQCLEIADICLQLTYCQDHMETCEAWLREH